MKQTEGVKTWKCAGWSLEINKVQNFNTKSGNNVIFKSANNSTPSRQIMSKNSDLKQKTLEDNNQEISNNN